MIEEGGRALAAYLKPREDGKLSDELAEQMTDAVKTIGQVAEYWLADPKRTLEAQSSLMKAYLDIWSNSVKHLAGEPTEAKQEIKDKRFADPEWSQNPFFDTLRQTYLATTDWAERMVREAEGLDEHTRHKAEFYVRQIAGAVSPSNFVLTNPALLRETFESNAENLARGLKMLAEDIQAGGGELKIRQTDPSKFEVGRNLATTPGKVIFENELMQLIQYAPSTAEVLALPLLIVPPWINKFYVLDLTPEKSLIKWAVDQGLTVFVVSWVNPDARLADKGFEHYMREGVLTALDQVRAVTGEAKAHMVGYCVGGTLLAATLGWLAAKGEDRAASATFLATQVDFTHAGDLKVFVDEDQLKWIERRMQELGYLDAGKMATAFNMLRANDLIWPYVINNYMRGKAPFPFDLLFWNSDSTRLPAANHSYYLRNCYLDNKLSKGEMELAGVRIDLKKTKLPVYNLATREDHIAPAKSVFLGSKFFGGPVRFVLTGSGHIAGVVNPPNKKKYQYWTGGKASGDLNAWIAKAKERQGSWWPDWFAWLKKHDPRRVAAREPGGGKLKPIEDAPGRYVKVQS
ncbi:MAG: class I poly(R)-hydroxyalkanoic acid synthase [Bradyrhizobiaceae bacterium]|nr:class I poly(R)-hydroxyalkanoic acid synthase [Bradyrhizobiaceae bacterium]